MALKRNPQNSKDEVLYVAPTPGFGRDIGIRGVYISLSIRKVKMYWFFQYYLTPKIVSEFSN